MEKPLNYDKLNEMRELSGKLTPNQRDVQNEITKQLGAFCDGMCERYDVAIDFKVMILFPKEWGNKDKHGKN